MLPLTKELIKPTVTMMAEAKATVAMKTEDLFFIQ